MDDALQGRVIGLARRAVNRDNGSSINTEGPHRPEGAS